MRRLVQPLAARDLALLISRVVIGVVFFAHGWQKLTEFGLEGTAESFSAMGVPAPALAAGFAGIVETVGGIALILGALTTAFSLLLVLDMVGAAVLVHVTKGVFVSNNGWELVGALGVGALLLAVIGAGAYSVDRLLSRNTVPADRPALETVSAP